MTIGNPSPLTTYVSKLENRRPITNQDRSLLLELPATLRQVQPQERFLRQGDLADQSVFLIDGLISRQKPVGGAGQLSHTHVYHRYIFFQCRAWKATLKKTIW